jgi:hypothetical protein
VRLDVRVELLDDHHARHARGELPDQPLGCGYAIPRLKTDASGNASFTYWYDTPAVTIPSDRSPHSIRFPSKVSANSRSSRVRSSTTTWRRLAFTGSITHLAGSRLNSGGVGGPEGSPRRTTPLAWAIRVVVLKKNGVSKRSESSNASRVYSFVSAESDGSSIGILAARA